MIFSLTCVCVCLCAKKFVCGHLTKELTNLDENLGDMLELATNREPPLASSIGPKFPQYLGGREEVGGNLGTLI